MRRRGDQSTPSAASKRGPSLAACIITTFVFDFPTGTIGDAPLLPLVTQSGHAGGSRSTRQSRCRRNLVEKGALSLVEEQSPASARLCADKLIKAGLKQAVTKILSPRNTPNTNSD